MNENQRNDCQKILRKEAWFQNSYVRVRNMQAFPMATRVKIRISQELYQDIQYFRYTIWQILSMQACESTFKGRKTQGRTTAFVLIALIFP